MPFVLRVRSPIGQSRIEVDDPSQDTVFIHNKLKELLKVDHYSIQVNNKPVLLKPNTPINSIFKHGDMLQVSCEKPVVQSTSTFAPVKLHPVDSLLEKESGEIKRTRSKFCNHGNGMCEYCSPLPPYDPTYLETNKIKHMSFHAFLKELKDKSGSLETPSFKVLTPCPSKHAPYPDGICSKCQPSAITLSSQPFRMVDHIEFESPLIIDTFLQAWRSTGSQRVGFMYGRYEAYTEVPLGVKAIVSVIYEPMQQDAVDSIQLAVPDPNEQKVVEITNGLGLELVGIIFTDLIDDGTGQGKVVCKRHADSYFLSSAECILAAQYQNMYPTETRQGKYGSRFVTCVLSGDENNGIDIFSYQVSVTAQAMVRDELLEACVEPGLMRVKLATPTLYVPEVFYKYKNEYNIMVKEPAKPTFPVEYLMVTVTHGFPSQPPPFKVDFPIENRNPIPLSSLKGKPFDSFDFHALYTLHEYFSPQDFQLLCQAIREKSDHLFWQLQERSSWQTLLMLMEEPSNTWTCRHCTFVNKGTDCEMCGLPNQ